MDRLWTTAEAAEEIGVIPRRVRQLCKRHGLGRKIGRDIVLTATDMRALRDRPWRRKAAQR